MLTNLTGLSAGAAVIFAGLLWFQTSRLDAARAEIITLKASNASLETNISINDRINANNAALLGIKTKELAHEKTISAALQRDIARARAIAPKEALKAPFRLGNDQRRDLMRILCVQGPCANHQSTNPAIPDPLGPGAAARPTNPAGYND